MRTILVLLAVTVAGLSAQNLSGQSMSEQSIDNGKRLFTRNGCYQCHGGVGQGGLAGPRLAQTKLPLAAFMAIIRNPPSSMMPPYREKTVSNKEAEDLYAYIKSFPAPLPAKDIPLLNQN